MEKRCTSDKKDGKYEKDLRTWDVNNFKILVFGCTIEIVYLETNNFF